MSLRGNQSWGCGKASPCLHSVSARKTVTTCITFSTVPFHFWTLGHISQPFSNVEIPALPLRAHCRPLGRRQCPVQVVGSLAHAPR